MVLITPYIKIPDDLLDRLRYMDNKGVKTTVVCREKSLKPGEKSELKKLKYIDLRFDEDLHAKCFYNEESMVITSLNLYEHSQLRNREMGILLNLKDEPGIFSDALFEAEFIVGRSKKDSMVKSILTGISKEAKSLIDSALSEEPERTRTKIRTQTRPKLEGHCIRCNAPILLDTKHPYCVKCFAVWSKYKDLDYNEKFCHKCGTSNDSSMKKPICISCFKKSKRYT